MRKNHIIVVLQKDIISNDSDIRLESIKIDTYLLTIFNVIELVNE